MRDEERRFDRAESGTLWVHQHMTSITGYARQTVVLGGYSESTTMIDLCFCLSVI